MAEAIIFGDSVLKDIRKDLAKEVKMDLARFIWELLGALILNCLRQWCFKRDVVLDCGATETAGGVEAVQILLDVFLILASKWTLWIDHGFVFLMVTGAGVTQESGC